LLATAFFKIKCETILSLW